MNHNCDMSALKDRLAEARIESNLSQAQLAKIVGAGQSTIASIENGRNKGSSLFLDLARALNVNVEWLMSGTGPKRGPIKPASPPLATDHTPWPFPSIPEKEVRALPPAQLSKLEGALALAIAQMKLDINVAPTPESQANARGSVVSMDDVEDPFPMRLKEPAPWEAGGVTTKQMEREGLVQFGLEQSTAANVAGGGPQAANEKFEKVLEMSDVRLSAGDGIEAEEELVTGSVQFRKSFLRSVGADRGRARVVYAKGDSMDPLIQDGWALLVVPDDNLTIRDLVPDTVYAINYDGKMIVKVIARDKLTEQWIARSANPKYRDFPLDAEGVSVRVLGRVVWAGGELREGDAAR